MYGLGDRRRGDRRARSGARGYDVVVADDRIDDAKRALADELGVELVERARRRSAGAARRGQSTSSSPAPGVPETHSARARRAAAAGVPVAREIELAYAGSRSGPAARDRCWPSPAPTARPPRRADRGDAARRRVTSRRRWATPTCRSSTRSTPTSTCSSSSAQLPAGLDRARSAADAAVWLNLAPDHLNWHASMDTYEAAKARIFDAAARRRRRDRLRRRPGRDGHLDRAPARQRTFGASRRRLPPRRATTLVGPARCRSPTSPTMRRRAAARHHQRARRIGARARDRRSPTPHAIADGARRRSPRPPHRLEPSGEPAASRWFNDSKATTPHAALTAIRGVRLARAASPAAAARASTCRRWRAESHRIRAVVAIGEAAADIARRVRRDDRRSSTPRRWPRRSPRPATWPVPATPSCCRPAAPASTGTRGYPARGDDFRDLVQRRLDHADDHTDDDHTDDDPRAMTAGITDHDGGRS